jgi:hypothetical protein
LVVNVFLPRSSEGKSPSFFHPHQLASFKGSLGLPIRKERGLTEKTQLTREAKEDKIHLGLRWLSNEECQMKSPRGGESRCADADVDVIRNRAIPGLPREKKRQVPLGDAAS